MKRTFSFLAIFLISLFSIFGGYNFKNYNAQIDASQQALISEENTNDVYSRINTENPTIITFRVNDNKTTTNSASVSWSIIDANQKVTKIEIYDKDSNTKLEEYDKSYLVATDAEVNDLNSNTNYNLELRVSWKDEGTIGLQNQVTKDTNLITKAVVPSSIELSLYKTNKSNVTLSIKYVDPDNVVDKITIHDKNGNINDIVLSPNDLDNGKYKLSKINSGNYDLELALHWTSLSGENIVSSTQSLEFEFDKIMNAALISTISIIVLLILLLIIFFILYFIKRKKTKELSAKFYYENESNYYNNYYDNGNSNYDNNFTS